MIKYEQKQLSKSDVFNDIIGQYTGQNLKRLQFNKKQYDSVIFEFQDDAVLKVNYNAGSLVAIIETINKNRRFLLVNGKDISEKIISVSASAFSSKNAVYSGREYDDISSIKFSEDNFKEVIKNIINKSLKSIQPTWAAEDWLNIRFLDNDSLIFRFDMLSTNSAVYENSRIRIEYK